MRKLIASLLNLSLIMFLLCAFSCSVFAYSSVFDIYSGSCGYVGIPSIDKFTSDDNAFYIEHYNDSYYYPSGYENVTVTMSITAKKHILIGWFSALTRTITEDIGVYQLDYPCGSGEYYMFFKVNGSKAKFINFHGTIYDNN